MDGTDIPDGFIISIMEAAGQPVPESKPILEVNPHHPLVEKLDQEADEDRFGDLASIADWAAKLAGAVARIAGTLHLVRQAEEHGLPRQDAGGRPTGRSPFAPWNEPISQQTMEGAIRIELVPEKLLEGLELLGGGVGYPLKVMPGAYLKVPRIPDKGELEQPIEEFFREDLLSQNSLPVPGQLHPDPVTG